MLARNLRVDRHPQHAAELRENIVPRKSLFLSGPVDSFIEHSQIIGAWAMDDYPALSTICLHEDLLARTLSHEQDIQRWRIAELEAGRGDPGRPTY